MKINDAYIYRANSTATKPYCFAVNDEWSVTFWLDQNGEVSGGLWFEYDDGKITKVVGSGNIPAEYVAVEENLRIR